MRSNTLLALLALAIALVLWACDRDVCSRHSDCAAGQTCTSAGICSAPAADAAPTEDASDGGAP